MILVLMKDTFAMAIAFFMGVFGIQNGDVHEIPLTTKEVYMVAKSWSAFSLREALDIMRN